jgi:hypothetical protein
MSVDQLIRQDKLMILLDKMIKLSFVEFVWILLYLYPSYYPFIIFFSFISLYYSTYI